MNFLSPAVTELTFTNLPGTLEEQMLLLHCSCFVQDFSQGHTKSPAKLLIQLHSVDRGASQHHLTPNI